MSTGNTKAKGQQPSSNADRDKWDMGSYSAMAVHNIAERPIHKHSRESLELAHLRARIGSHKRPNPDDFPFRKLAPLPIAHEQGSNSAAAMLYQERMQKREAAERRISHKLAMREERALDAQQQSLSGTHSRSSRRSIPPQRGGGGQCPFDPISGILQPRNEADISHINRSFEKAKVRSERLQVLSNNRDGVDILTGEPRRLVSPPALTAQLAPLHREAS